jgi:hypothetical protein
MQYGLPDIINGIRGIIATFGYQDVGSVRRAHIRYGLLAVGRGDITSGYFTRVGGNTNAFASGKIFAATMVQRPE